MNETATDDESKGISTINDFTDIANESPILGRSPQAAEMIKADTTSSSTPFDTGTPQNPMVQQSTPKSTPTPTEESTPSHVHNWINKTEIIHHDAVYETVWHEPVYETRTTYHDICNQCGAILDGGKAAQHLKSTSCTSCSTDVPRSEQVLVSEGYSERILAQAAWDETVVVGKYCSCGANA